MSRPGESWTAGDVARWEGLSGASAGSHRVIAADLDNNGALDLVASGGGASRIWLAGVDHTLQPLNAPLQGEVSSILDLNADGLLDLARSVRRPRRSAGSVQARAGYHWKVIRPRAQQNAGDQRINAFGVGGEIQVRSGLLVQTQVLAGAPLHFGLGTRTSIDVARIVWPNGVAQAEFRGGVDDAIVAEQRLKGSCPWVFAWDGSRMGFVTDFLWRSPLGLRINAQDTAGVTQTEDWVKISGESAHAARWDVRHPDHGGALGDALLRSGVAASRGSSGGDRGLRGRAVFTRESAVARRQRDGRAVAGGEGLGRARAGRHRTGDAARRTLSRIVCEGRVSGHRERSFR